jgi:CBS domain-containing protein
VRRTAAELGLELDHACWLALGSQGRQEQTLATDQDNGLVLDAGVSASERGVWLELGRRVNLALGDCGYALCRGKVMAGEPACCLVVNDWGRRFDHWMEHGAPQDLLSASIYFDLRPVVGRHELVLQLRRQVVARAAALPRFIKQMADNALRYAVPLGWFGSIRPLRGEGRPMFDLKMQGTALFVEAARLYALALGIEATATGERLAALADRGHAPVDERLAWTQGFETLQRLRLQLQARPDVAEHNPNLVVLDSLAASDREQLKRALRAARLLQRRIELDYRR